MIVAPKYAFAFKQRLASRWYMFANSIKRSNVPISASYTLGFHSKMIMPMDTPFGGYQYYCSARLHIRAVSVCGAEEDAVRRRYRPILSRFACDCGATMSLHPQSSQDALPVMPSTPSLAIIGTITSAATGSLAERWSGVCGPGRRRKR